MYMGDVYGQCVIILLDRFVISWYFLSHGKPFIHVRLFDHQCYFQGHTSLKSFHFGRVAELLYQCHLKSIYLFIHEI